MSDNSRISGNRAAGLNNMSFTSNLIGGAQIAFYVTFVLAISGIGTSYLLPDGNTLNEYIERRTGLDTSAGVV
jgi:hypothetical protein